MNRKLLTGIVLQPRSSRAASNTESKDIVAKVFTIPVLPDPSRRRGKQRSQDPRYIEAQQLLVDAMK